MLTVLLTFRNARSLTMSCLTSVGSVFQQIAHPSEAEFILIDDASDPEHQIPQLLQDFKRSMQGFTVHALHCKQRQHYTYGLALGMSLARGERILFISHDMILTPSYVKTILAVAATDDRIGLVRGTSRYTEGFPQYQVEAPLKLQTMPHIEAFAEFVASYWGLRFTDDDFLTGDAFLVKRAVLDKIGVFDTRYFGYFGDIDFGLRVQLAGFRMGCARGAWLYHEGAGYYKSEAQTRNEAYDRQHAARMQVVQEQYEKFIAKWDPGMPPKYPDIVGFDFRSLRAKGPVGGDLYYPPIGMDGGVVEVL